MNTPERSTTGKLQEIEANFLVHTAKGLLDPDYQGEPEIDDLSFDWKSLSPPELLEKFTGTVQNRLVGAAANRYANHPAVQAELDEYRSGPPHKGTNFFSPTRQLTEQEQQIIFPRIGRGLDSLIRSMQTGQLESEQSLISMTAAYHLAWLSNYGLGVHFALQKDWGFLDRADLVQEGQIGVGIATVRYDSNRDTKFSTYAKHWIRAKVAEEQINSGRIIKLPSKALARFMEIKTATSDLLQDLNREPTDQEIANALAMENGEVTLIRQRGNRQIATPSEAAAAAADRDYLSYEDRDLAAVDTHDLVLNALERVKRKPHAVQLLSLKCALYLRDLVGSEIKEKSYLHCLIETNKLEWLSSTAIAELIGYDLEDYYIRISESLDVIRKTVDHWNPDRFES